MGTVYLANRADQEFRKRVAIKVIRVEKLSDFAIRRFRQERQILARLEHANVARLIDGGTTESGLPYLVMEFVEGEILTKYCDLHGLAVTERCELFLKICSAVQYAHERNIIHRDLKPANILVGRTGNPKLLDFGVAKMLEPENSGVNKEATLAGVRMLTPAYASPEQLQGDPVTSQSDIYSLGVILYELLCGERPSLKTVQQSSSNPGGRDEHISPSLRAIIFNAIRLDPAERYESVAAMAEDIQKHLKGFPTSAGLSSASEEEERISIGVLPFRELGQDQKADPFLRSAITDALITRLSKVERLSVRPTSAVLRYAEGGDPVHAARELRVRYLLEGTFHTVGDHVRLNVQLVSSDTGRSVWAAHFDEQSGDLLRLEDSISEQIAFALIPHLTGEERLKLSRAGTANSKAHEAYLRGRYHWSRSAGEPEQLAKALMCFMEAIEHDASYARAHSGIADYYVRLGLWGGVPPAETFAAALISARHAVALDPTLGDAHASLGFCLWTSNRDYTGAEREFNIAIAHSPDSASAHHWFGLLNSARARPELALANLERAHKIDPNSPVITASHGFVYFNARQYKQALDLLQAAARERRDSGVLQELQAWCYLQMGDFSHAKDCALKGASLSARSPASLAALARAEAAAGNLAAAEGILEEMKQLASKRYVSGYDFASVYLALGDKQAALTNLEDAYQASDWWVNWIGVHPAWDSLRGEPRFAALVAQMQPEPADKTETAPSAPATQDSKVASMVVLAVVAVLVLGALALTYVQSRKAGEPFANPQFARITGDGTTGLAAVSPNGEDIVYTTRKKGWTQLWKRKVGTSGSSSLTAPIQGDAVSLEFTDNGNRVAFAIHPALQIFHRNLFTVPLEGGIPVQILGEVPGPVGISRDGTKAAIVRANRALNRDEIWIADLKTGGERLITSRQYPTHLLSQASPAWSRDGKRLAFSVETKDNVGFYIYLQTIDLETGQEHRVQSPRWQWVEDIEWFSGQSALAIVARPQGSSFKQIWYVGYPGGASRRLGSDIDSYNTVSVSDDGETLASIQLQTLSNIYVAPSKDVDHSVQVTPGTGRYFDLSWTSDDRILYASDATGEADLWTIKADGSEQRQITSGGGLKWAPVSSPDGRYLAYHSNVSGSWNIWRTDADGSNPVQITQGPRDSNWPHFTPDSKFVVFHQTDPGGQLNLWKVPILGGTPIQLTSSMTTHPAVSPKDGKLVAWYSKTVDHPQWKLAVFAPSGGAPLQVFTPSVAISADSQLGWSPTGDAITCLGQESGGWNVWNQPIDGRPAKRLTSFVSGQIYSFDWSKDGRLAFSHGVSTTDVVIVRDKRRKS
jgi:serine/threonine protein kinase/Tol biopolymer transport system component/Tfp pilus assembly protein PilF